MEAYNATLIVVLKLLIATVCGAAIGLERELSRKPAGLRTNVLICMGATLFMIISRHISGGAPYTDPARLVAQVVAGIGFLGAGVIIQSRASVTGLTTAATIFLVGAVGIAIGEAMYIVAGLATVLILSVLVLLRRLERYILMRGRTFQYSVVANDPVETLSRLHKLLDDEGLHLDNYRLRDKGDGTKEVSFSVITSLDGNARILAELQAMGTAFHSASHES